MVETIKTYAGSDIGVSQCLVTLESFIGDTNEQELDDGTVLDASDAVTAINGLIWSLERREAAIALARAALQKLVHQGTDSRWYTSQHGGTDVTVVVGDALT